MVLFEPVTAILDKMVSSGRTLNGIIFFDAQNSICLFPKKGSNLIGGSVFIYLQRLERDDFFKFDYLTLDNVTLQFYKLLLL